ncbi:coiled-coil domain-containing protein 60-like isoform X2 [Puntigrus tetrazona]|uniref:coiled-coil domain-containing protein 60-like isoform X2 n=1 Tax=Puntigrus tetrazona TaxID=1606681 RepID=UPI001C88E942|nr:coiled-coil domain-containing protein 60-like isoform X2 [Puntigrus tetrazona]
MAVQSHVSDSGSCKAEKAYECEMFWERFRRRQEPLTHRVYGSLRRSCAENALESLHLEAKNLITNYLGQADKAPNEKISEADDDLVHESPPHSSQENEKVVPKWSWKREDAVLRKLLHRTRRHVLAVKQGRSYFHLLQEEAQEEQRRERRRREEVRRGRLRPPALSDSDEDSDAERWCDVTATSSADREPNKRKIRARPFTPIHRSLISTPPHLLPGERVYRQLCCLNWLLEALTLERSGRVGPVTSCWDARDPGTSSTTIKRLNKEKAIEAKWEQFIAPPKMRQLTSRASGVSSGRHPLRKTSSSASGSSAGSLSSRAPAPDHTCDESAYTKGMETDSGPPSCEYLEKFLQEVCLKNCDKRLASSASAPIIRKEEVMSGGKKPSVVAKAEKLTLSLSDALDLCAKKRWDFGVQGYSEMLSCGRIRSAVTSKTSLVSPRAPDSNIPEEPCSTQWRVARLLEKLSRFTAGRCLQLHTQHFLRILGSLQAWELCCPDLCVAIEIVRLNVVKMPKAEYDSWLKSRVKPSQALKSAAHNP